VHDNVLEHVAHLEVQRVLLIVEDVAAGERGLVEVPDEDLLVQRQVAESVRVDLDDGGLADLLEQVDAIARVRRRHSIDGRRAGPLRPGRRLLSSRERSMVRHRQRPGSCE
jgi:hypothetical protein